MGILRQRDHIGCADFDSRQRFAFSATHDMPRLADAVANNVIVGRQLAAAGVFKTGLPFTVNASAPFGAGSDFNADGDTYDVTNALPFGNHIKGASRADFQRGLFKASDLPLRPSGTEGGLDRNTFDHPGYAPWTFNS